MGRKRRRGTVSDEDSSAPISKRINQLHIQNNRTGEAGASNQEQQQQQGAEPNIVISPGRPPLPPLVLPPAIAPPGHPSTAGAAAPPPLEGPQAPPAPEPEVSASYGPDLNHSQNPHYYSANETLFHAHHARLKRSRSLMNRSFPNS